MTGEQSSTSQLIRKGAFEVLLNEGLPHLSYDRVAQAAGVTRQLVRYYYPNAETLMLELCDDLAARYREILLDSVADKTGADRITVFFDFYFDLLDGQAKPRDDQVYDALLSLSAGSEPIKTNLRQQYQLLGQVLSHEIKQVHQGLPIESCEEIAYLLITLMYGHWKMVATLGMNPANNRVARQAMDRLIASYLAQPDATEGTSVFKNY